MSYALWGIGVVRSKPLIIEGLAMHGFGDAGFASQGYLQNGQIALSFLSFAKSSAVLLSSLHF